MHYRKHDRHQIAFKEPSHTVQAFKDECDINKILEGYLKTGMIEHANTVQGRYGDFTSAPDYQAACQAIIDANDMFNTLPAKIRKQFDNDPAEFLEFAQNPSNEAEMRSMGLLADTYPERDKYLSSLTGEASGAAPQQQAQEASPSASADSTPSSV